MPKEKLNENQKRAVEHHSGPLLVVAGAGTGKTRIISEKIKLLMHKEKLRPSQILALTFTDKAAREMQERVEDAMPLGYVEPYICTFHSFADRVLRQSGLEIGLDTGYKIMTYPQQWVFVRNHLYEYGLDYFLPLGNPSKFISSMLKFVSRLQDEDISPTDLSLFAQNFSGDSDEKKRWTELAGFYEKYSQQKIAESKMDFGDLITWCLRLFRERPAVLKKYRQEFKHVMVDEFQDTNLAQYQIVKLLFPADSQNRSLTVVGDDFQSIYKFRGAAVSNILEFKEDYPTAEFITLTENYRSTQKILDASYKLVKNNDPDTLETKLGISKKLSSNIKPKNSACEVIELPGLEEEVDFTMAKIKSLVDSEPDVSYRDIAILARANNHLDPFILGLRRAGIPYQLAGNRGLYDREEIKNVLALLKVLVADEDVVALYRCLNIEVFQIEHNLIHTVLSSLRFNKQKFYDALKNSQNEKFQNFISMVEKYRGLAFETLPSQLLHALLTEIHFLNTYIKEETVENNLSIKNLNILFERIKEFERTFYNEKNTRCSIHDLQDYFDLMIEAGDNPAQAEIEDIDTVVLSTVHSSKGLEFAVVFMVNLIAGRFPSRDRSEAIEIPEELIKEILPEGDPHIQEERRLFYVAMTRARRFLYMSYANNYGGKRDSVPSAFLNETGITVKRLEDLPRNGDSSLFGMESGYKKALNLITNFDFNYISYSQIASYETCPLQYKFSYILKIPTIPSHSLSFGNTIHTVLREFESRSMNNHNWSVQELLEFYKQNWDPIGYEDISHKQNRYESGIKLLKSYYELRQKEPTRVLYLEQNFQLRLDGVKFGGRIDRIDALDGEGKSVEIIDYKTGKSKDQKEVDKDLQVGLYAWAASEGMGLNPEKLSLFFVEDLLKVSTSRTQAQIEENKEKAVEVIKKIKSGDFSANPGKHCDWCDYQSICPYRYKSS